MDLVWWETNHLELVWWETNHLELVWDKCCSGARVHSLDRSVTVREDGIWSV